MDRPTTDQPNNDTEIQQQHRSHHATREARRRVLNRFKKMGPLELSLLERVEEGLHQNRRGTEQPPTEETKSPEVHLDKNGKKVKKYTGEKQVLDVKGWARVNELYGKYTTEFISKAIMGSLLLVVAFLVPGHWELLTLTATFLAMLCCAMSLWNLFLVRRSNRKLIQIFTIEGGIKFCYMLVALGATSYFYFPDFRFSFLFCIPYVAFGIYIVFQNHGENDYTGSKIFTILEAVQFLVIALRANNWITLHWNYAMVYFLLTSIYMIVLGSILTVILGCSTMGYIYQGLELWKLKSLIWLTVYYFGYGYGFVEMMKCFNAKSYLDKAKSVDLRVWPHATDLPVFITSAVIIIVTSVACLVMHVWFKQDIKKYFARVMFKGELRTEISLKKVRSDYPLRFIQLSGSFFKRETDLPNEQKAHEDDVTQDNVSVVGGEIDGKQDAKPKAQKPKIDNTDKVSVQSAGVTTCIICYTNEPNTLAEPCGHGGVCEDCMFQLIQKDRNCPFCRQEMDTIYLVKKQPGTNVIKLDKEIALSMDKY